MNAFSICYAQDSKKTDTVQKDTVKQMNLLDEQTKMYGKVFELAGLGEEDNPLGEASSYRELIEKMEIPTEQKKEILELYELYDMSLDPKMKKEFELKLNKKLEKGLRNAKNEN